MKVIRRKKDPVTREELKSEIALVRLDIKEAFQKHEEQHTKDKDEILTKMDEIAGELQTMREENSAGTLRLRDHEKRITVLEQAA